MSRLLVVGGGGHGKVVAEAAIASGQWQQIAFLDARFPALSQVLTWPVIGSDAEPAQFLRDYPTIFIAIGDNNLRLSLGETLEQNGFVLPTIIHPAAWVSPSARLGAGSLLVAASVVNAGAVLGRACIVNSGATIDHDCSIADGVHISPGAHLGGGVVVGARTGIGIGASIRHGVRIGADVMVGAGAAVVDDLPDAVTAVGVPARTAKRL